MTKPTRDCDVRAGAGCKVVITIGPSVRVLACLLACLLRWIDGWMGLLAAGSGLGGRKNAACGPAGAAGCVANKLHPVPPLCVLASMCLSVRLNVPPFYPPTAAVPERGCAGAAAEGGRDVRAHQPQL